MEYDVIYFCVTMVGYENSNKEIINTREIIFLLIFIVDTGESPKSNDQAYKLIKKIIYVLFLQEVYYCKT